MEKNSQVFKDRILLVLNEGPSCISELSRILDESNEFTSGYLHCMADFGMLTQRNIGKAKMFTLSADANFPLSKDGGDGIGTTVQRFSVNTGQTDSKEKVNNK